VDKAEKRNKKRNQFWEKSFGLFSFAFYFIFEEYTLKYVWVLRRNIKIFG
jgi:hypothetical protein